MPPGRPRKVVRRRFGPARRRMWGRKKFLRKYTKGLGSADKVYAFKRLGLAQDIHNAGGSIVVGGYTDCIKLGSVTTSYGDMRQVQGAMRFHMSDLTTSSDLTNLFDQYKLSGVKVRIWWACTQAPTGTGIPAPRMVYAIDEDDDSVTTDIRQKNNVKIHQFSNATPLSLYLKPRFAKQVYKDTGTTIGFSTGTGYVDSTYPDAAHYGLKFLLQDVWAPNDTDNDYRSLFRVETTYYVKCKGVQ